MFAGPNGSGKSTIKEQILPPALIGFYVNADDIEAGVLESGSLDLGSYQVRSNLAMSGPLAFYWMQFAIPIERIFSTTQEASMISFG
jgi:predicted ABC-type ATPase